MVVRASQECGGRSIVNLEATGVSAGLTGSVRRSWKICSDVAELGEVRASSAQGWRRSRTVSRPPIVACACLQDGDSSVAVAQSGHYNVRNRTSFIIFTNRLVFRSGYDS